MTELETAMLVFQTVDAILRKAGYRPGDPRIERILYALIDAHEAMVRHYDPGKKTVQ